MLRYFFLLLSTLSLHALVLESPAFQMGGEIPTKYGCSPDARSPELVWSGVPSDTVVFAVVITDKNNGMVQGKLYNIPRDITHLAEGSIPYSPPCPPPDQRHTIEFALYALDREIIEDWELQNHILQDAKLIGFYHTIPKPPMQLNQ